MYGKFVYLRQLAVVIKTVFIFGQLTWSEVLAMDFKLFTFVSG